MSTTALDHRTRILVEAPVLRTLLRMAVPNVLTMVVQASIGLVEAYYIGGLGTDALAGVAAVFPGLMLMQMLAAGAMGGGVSSAIARALGSGRRDDAEASVLHALLIGLALGFFFTAAALLGGPWFYRALGLRDASLDAALVYSNVLFAGAVLPWTFNTLANVVRGTGNMIVPATVICVGALALIALSPILIFGRVGLPALGVAGAALAILLYYGVGTAVLALYLATGRSVLHPKLWGVRLRWPLFYEILRVGTLASLIAFMTNLTVAVTTGMVGTFGPAAIAGYGVGSRLEYLLVPLTFGFGAPLVALVGTNIGAGKRDRAIRTAWIGGGLAFALTEAIGLAGAAAPVAWLSLFGNDPEMIAAGTAYLRAVGPFYGFFGLGMALYFASQGAGRLWWPLLAAVIRLVIAVGGGWLMLRWTGEPFYVFLALGVALFVFGAINTAAVAAGTWFKARAA
jgi:putative MATE family efflux protein